MVCVVRDIYFEPALGHTAARVLADIRAHHQLGRPALLEMHRFNFTGEGVEADASFVELRRVLEGARDSIPRLRYLSTLELAEALRVRDPALVDRRLAARVRALVLRAATQPRLYKLAWITGLAAVAAAALAIATASLRPAPEQRQRPR
jgi:hypothetical protein